METVYLFTVRNILFSLHKFLRVEKGDDERLIYLWVLTCSTLDFHPFHPMLMFLSRFHMVSNVINDYSISFSSIKNSKTCSYLTPLSVHYTLRFRDLMQFFFQCSGCALIKSIWFKVLQIYSILENFTKFDECRRC